MNDTEKLDLIIREVGGLKTEMQDMKTEMQDMKTEMQDMKTEMQDMKSDIQDLKSEMKVVKTDIGKLQNSMKRVELHLENVTDNNIRLVAEGHLNLHNKLSEATKVSNFQEMLGVRVNILEEDVKLLKEAIAINPA